MKPDMTPTITLRNNEKIERLIGRVEGKN